MLGGKHRQARGHCFEHRIRNAFLISVAASLARVQKDVRAIIDLTQLLLRNETRERDVVSDT